MTSPGPSAVAAGWEEELVDTGEKVRRQTPAVCIARKKIREMRNHSVKLAPSILAADFARLGEQVADFERAGADRIHVDVMDGHFVPNIAIGAPIVQSLRRITRLAMEIHMMISNPDFFLNEFIAAGSDFFLVHWEDNNNLHRTVERIRALGKRAGVVINPATPAAVLEEILPDVDEVLVMTVDPGFGHQQFLPSTLPKIRRVCQMIESVKPECELGVDGGIDAATAGCRGRGERSCGRVVDLCHPRSGG